VIGVVDLGKRGGVVGVPTTLSEANGVRGCGLSNSAGALEQKLGAEDTAARDRCEGTGVIPSFDSLGRLSEELVTAAEPPRGLNGGVDPAARTGARLFWCWRCVSEVPGPEYSPQDHPRNIERLRRCGDCGR